MKTKKPLCNCENYMKKSKTNYDCKNCDGRNMSDEEFKHFKNNL